MIQDLSWRAILDGMRADLDRATAAFDAGDFVGLPSFHPPEDIAPIPMELADEARALVRRHDELVAAVAERRDAADAANASSFAGRPAGRGAARFEALA